MKFAKDYWELCKHTGRFYRDHWLGIIVISTAMAVVEMELMFPGCISDTIKEKLCKEENEKE